MYFRNVSTHVVGNSSATTPIAMTSNWGSYSAGSISISASCWAAAFSLLITSLFTIASFLTSLGCFASYLMTYLLEEVPLLSSVIRPRFSLTYFWARCLLILSYLAAKCYMHLFKSKLYIVYSSPLVGWVNSLVLHMRPRALLSVYEL